VPRIFYLTCFFLCFLSGCASSATPPSQPSTQVTQGPTATQTARAADRYAATSSIPGIHLPAGFQISVYASGLHTPRFMTIGPNDTLLVANRGGDSIIALPTGASAAQAGTPKIIASNLNDPTSLVVHEGYLYVGEGASIARMALGDDLKTGPIQRIITDLPQGGQHSTRTVLIGPDKHIYVSIGSDCDACIEQDPHRASVWVYNMDGSQGHLYAKGLRNAVGMAVNPWTQQIWVDVNGRDYMGDNIPPETVYTLTDQGDYGWPRCHGGNIPDPQFGQTPNACQGVQQPLVKMQAHSAPLGMDFYPVNATQFPTEYRDSLYIAFHGSWNRTTPTGYKVVRVALHNGEIAGPATDFISGWLKSDGSVGGRPAGVTIAPDGTLFVSDDMNGAIYHIWYRQ
jgi:glucose/arabinose dehydrogenase